MYRVAANWKGKTGERTSNEWGEGEEGGIHFQSNNAGQEGVHDGRANTHGAPWFLFAWRNRIDIPAPSSPAQNVYNKRGGMKSAWPETGLSPQQDYGNWLSDLETPIRHINYVRMHPNREFAFDPLKLGGNTIHACV